MAVPYQWLYWHVPPPAEGGHCASGGGTRGSPRRGPLAHSGRPAAMLRTLAPPACRAACTPSPSRACLRRAAAAATATAGAPRRPSASTAREPASPLASFLTRQIMFSGPIPVSQYMSLCLMHPRHGYYTARPTVLGAKGDFVTAPEVSQVFGEMVAVWVANVASQMGASDGFALAELGPGKGTLMRDILRSLRAFGALPKQVHLVEASTVLRNVQKACLARIARENGVDLRWHASLAQVPDPGAAGCGDQALQTIYVAQEFFDALPVHVFQRAGRGQWRERFVDIVREGDEDVRRSALHFRYVLAPGDTPASTVYAARFLRDDAPDVVELCADGIAIAEELGSRVSRSGGAVLIVDYGSDAEAGIPHVQSTVRAIRGHAVTDALSRPGQSDVTADVNFSHLRAALAGSGASFRGTVSQRHFLLNLGAAARFRALGAAMVDDVSLNDAETDKRLESLQRDHDRLLSAREMGSIYRAAAISHASILPPALDESRTG
jgi:NADH dehydrogenase [ubiquinone] 1 alpha subcomplex assembly factor 7